MAAFDNTLILTAKMKVLAVIFLSVLSSISSNSNVVSAQSGDSLDCVRARQCFFDKKGILADFQNGLYKIKMSQNLTKAEMDAKFQEICNMYQPIINCAGEAEARNCDFSVGDGRVFRISSPILICQVRSRLAKCGMEVVEIPEPPPNSACPISIASGAQPTINGDICDRRFPDIDTKQGFNDDTYNCTRLKLYTGCMLYHGKSICGKKIIV